MFSLNTEVKYLLNSSAILSCSMGTWLSLNNGPIEGLAWDRFLTYAITRKRIYDTYQLISFQSFSRPAGSQCLLHVLPLSELDDAYSSTCCQLCKRDLSLRDKTMTSDFCHETRPRPCKAETFFETLNFQHCAKIMNGDVQIELFI